MRSGSLLLAAAGLLVAVTASGAAARWNMPDPKAKLAARAEVTFNRDVAPIVLAQCATCHRPGEVAPFSLLTYEDAHKRARQIALVTSQRVTWGEQTTDEMCIAFLGYTVDSERLRE